MKQPSTSRWLPAALLLSATSSPSPSTVLAAENADTTPDDRRALRPEAKSFGAIGDRFESLALATHAAVSKLARGDVPSNDDPNVQLLLSVTVDGTRLTLSPASSPAGPEGGGAAAGPTSPPKATVEWIGLDLTEFTEVVPTLSPTAQAFDLSPMGAEPSLPSKQSPQSSVPSMDPTSHPIDESQSSSPSLDVASGTDTPGTDGDEIVGGADDIGTSTTSSTSPRDAPTKPPPTSSTASTLASTQTSTSSWLETTNSSSLPSSPPPSAPSEEVTESHSSTSVTTTGPSVQNSTSDADINSSTAQECPPEFNRSVTYEQGDLVSIQRNRCGAGRACHAMFRCMPWPESIFCNRDDPGQGSDDKGWEKIGSCFVSPVDGSEIVDVSAVVPVDGGSRVPSMSPVVGSSGDANGTESLIKNSAPTTHPAGPSVPSSSSTSPLHIDDDQPTMSPTAAPSSNQTPRPTAKRPLGQSPTWSNPSDNASSDSRGDGDDGANPAADTILVDLPRIICDMTLPSSLSATFEKTHVLLAAMTTMLHDLISTHLPIYDLGGISLNVEVQKDENPGGADDSADQVRLHAYFSGSASFSPQGAPTRNELIAILIRHFQVDDFQGMLQHVPQIMRTATTAAKDHAESLQVHSVFFTLEDGRLVLAGSTYEENRLPTTVLRPTEEKQKVQVIFVLLALISIACILALAIFYLVSNKMKSDDEEDNICTSSDESNLEEGRSSAAERATEVEVEIEVPSTPAIKDMSDVSGDNSIASSLTESPFPALAQKKKAMYGASASASPSDPCLGIANPNCYRYSGESALGFALEQPGSNSANWEVYQDNEMELP